MIGCGGRAVDAPEIFAVINPVAGGGTGLRAWLSARPVLQAAGRRTVEATARAPLEAWRLAERAAREGFPVVAAVGGDGTVHEVLNGLLRGRPEHPPALAVIPAGTGNIFAHAFSLPRQPRAAARALVSGARRRIDVGLANERYFASVAGVGFDGEIVSRAGRWPGWIDGKIRHIAVGLLVLAAYQATPVRVRIDGAERRLPLFLLAAANTPWYGGGIQIAPHARPDDGALAVVTITEIGRLEAFRLLARSFSGRHLGHTRVEHTSAKQVHVDSDIPLRVHADGEAIGCSPVTFQCVPGALELLIPRGR